MKQEILERLQELIDGVDELRAEMPMDSKEAELLQDAYYLLLDAQLGEK
jgi:hypothetical protein